MWTVRGSRLQLTPCSNIEFYQELGAYCDEYDCDSQVLPYCGSVLIESDADKDCEYFSSCYDKGNHMLFEMADHSVDEHLSDSRKNRHHKHVNCEKRTIIKEN